MSSERQPVLGPMMDGRRSFEPIGRGMPGMGPRSLTPTMYERFPRSLPPINTRVMPPPGMPRRVIGPPTLMPWWGGQRVIPDKKKSGKEKVHRNGEKIGENVTKGQQRVNARPQVNLNRPAFQYPGHIGGQPRFLPPPPHASPRPVLQHPGHMGGQPRFLPPPPHVSPRPMLQHPGHMGQPRYIVPPQLNPKAEFEPIEQIEEHTEYVQSTPTPDSQEIVYRGRPQRPVGPPPAVIQNPQPSPVLQPPNPTRPKVVTIPIYVKKRIRKILVPKKKKVNKSPRKHRKMTEALLRFRYAVIAVVFIEHLKINLRKVLDNRPSSVFLFGIILKEIVAALHRIYLNPDGNIYPVLSDIIGTNCYDLSALVHGGIDDQEEAVLIQELQYVLENVIYHITEIMPATGVLGTHKKSAVFELIRNGKRFPDGYFWQVEMDRLQFNEHGRTINNGDYESFLLLVGIFISRSMVTTLLMKPTDYGLSSTQLSEVGERNLRIVATTLLYLVRRVTQSRAQGMMGVPAEIAKYLYDDGEMQHVYSRMSRTFNYCEGLLREWGTEYVRRLRDSSFNK